MNLANFFKLLHIVFEFDFDFFFLFLVMFNTKALENFGISMELLHCYPGGYPGAATPLLIQTRGVKTPKAHVKRNW